MWGQTGSCDSACEPGCWLEGELEGARWLALAPGSEWAELTGREVCCCAAQNYQLPGALRLHLLPCSQGLSRASDGPFSPSAVAAGGTSAAAAADVIFAAVAVVVVDVAVVVAAVDGGDGAQGQTWQTWGAAPKENVEGAEWQIAASRPRGPEHSASLVAGAVGGDLEEGFVGAWHLWGEPSGR